MTVSSYDMLARGKTWLSPSLPVSSVSNTWRILFDSSYRRLDEEDSTTALCARQRHESSA